MRRSLAALLAVTALVSPAAAIAQPQVVSERPESVAVTVYPGGIAMVRETRTVTLPPGKSRVAFRAVADRILAHTVAVEGLPGPLAEQNFDYRILSPAALVRAAEGQMVTAVRTDRATGRVTTQRGRLVGSAEGTMLETGGRVEALGCSGAAERLVFDGLPAGYVEVPTLSADTRGPGGTARITLSYLTVGLTWQTHYVARLAPGRDRLGLTAWITIHNESGTTFGGAPVQVVAGRLQQVPGADVSPVPFVETRQPGCWRTNSGRRVYGLPVEVIGAEELAARGNPSMEDVIRDMSEVGNVQAQAARGVNAGGYGVSALDLGDYKLYNLPEPTTLAARQTKQLLMFDRQDVAVRRVHRVVGAGVTDCRASSSRTRVGFERDAPGYVVVELRNAEDRGLGLPLPAGLVSVFRAKEAGASILADEVFIRDTARDTPFELVLRNETDGVLAKTRVLSCRSFTGARGRRARAGIEQTLSNPTDRPITFQLRESTNLADLRILREDVPHVIKDGFLQWEVTVPARTVRTVRMTAQWRGG